MFNTRSYDDTTEPTDPDVFTKINRVEVSPELLRNTLRVDTQGIIEVHAAKYHDFEDIDNMVKSIIFEVYTRKHGTKTAASKALKVNRGTFSGWSKL